MNQSKEKTVSLAASAAWIMFAKLLAFAFNIALPFLLVRRLSQTSFGLYKQAFLVVSTSIAMLPMGFSMTAFFFLPRETEKKSAVVFNILLFNLTVSTFALLVLVFFPQLLANLLVSDQVAAQDPQIRGQIVALAPLIGFVILTWLISAFLELIAVANQETKLASVFIILAQFTKALLLLSAALVFGTVRSLLTAALIQGVLQTAILCFYLQRCFPAFWRSFDWGVLKRQITYALPYGLSSLIWTLQTDIHSYFVSHNFGQAGFAIYAVGVFQLPLVGILTESAASVMIPRVSYLQSVDNKREIISLIAGAMRGLAIVFFPLYGVLLVMREEFIVALFTKTYITSVPIFLINITLLPFSITLLDSIARAYIEIGKFITRMRVVFFVVLAAGLWLAVRSGDLRLVAATVIGVYITEHLLMLYKSSRVLGVERRDISLLRDVGKIALATIVASAVTVFVRQLLLPYELKAMVLLILGGMVFGLFYLLAMLRLRVVTDHEWNQVYQKLGKIRGKFPILQDSF
jgi:O-antigen/teichoic acid export membrane protein